VDDGSTDRTAEVAALAGAAVFKHQSNKGYGVALNSCFKLARNNGISALVILDADGQHDPNQIPRILRPVLRDEADVCVGCRFIEGSHLERIPRYRRFGIKSLTRAANLVSPRGSTLSDSTSGFRAYSNKAIDSISITEDGMGATTEILLQAKKKDLRIKEIPISCRYDVNNEGKSTAKTAFSIAGSILRYLETEHALITFGVPGLMFFVSGFILGNHVLNVYNATHDLAIGLAMITMLLLVLGMLLGFTGLILHAVIAAKRRVL